MIKPINITGAALFAQFSIIFIMFMGSFILYTCQDYVLRSNRPKYLRLPWIILAFSLISIGCLLFTDEFSKVWAPLFGTLSFPTISWSIALHTTFYLNIACGTVLILLTGGSRHSSFTPLFFLLPALAIFLREPLFHILIYLLMILTIFLISMKWSVLEHSEKEKHNYAYGFVSIACLILSTLIGYVTRLQ
jgi:hypothetical protein